VIGAHPDDADLITGGLAIKHASRGNKVKYVSVTNGDMGHFKDRDIILAARRYYEAKASAEKLGVEYDTLNIGDGDVWVNRENLRKVMRCIREFAPDLIITHRPNDYHKDHRYVGQLVMDASYMLIVPHYMDEFRTPYVDEMPVICYGYDHFENPVFRPDVLLDITDVYERKALAISQHVSQLMEWLPYTQGVLDQIPEEYDYKQRREIVETLVNYHFSTLISRFRKLLKKGYPDRKVKQAEAYEICPYGKEPSIKLLKELFPGAIFPSKRELDEVTEIGKLKAEIKSLKKEIKEVKKKLEGKPEIKHGVPMVTWRMYEKDYPARHLLHHVVEKWAKEKPSEVVLISANTGRDYTWAQFKDAMDGLALKLIDMGVEKGDFVASSLPFFPEHVFLMYACFKIGAAIFAPLDLRLKPPETQRCINLINARVYAHLGKTDIADFGKMSEAVMNNCDSLKYCIQFSSPDDINEGNDITEVISALDFALDAQELLRKVNSGERKELANKLQERSESVKETDGCLVIYTTGSTSGYPKPALLSHQGITVQNLCLGMGFGFDNEDDVMMVNLPPSHVGGTTEQLMTPLFFGAKAVLLDIFKPDLSLEAIEKYKVTVIGQIPALFNMQWRMPNFKTYDLSSLKFALYGGQSVSREFLEKLSKMAPKFGTGLGLTELSGFCTYTPLDGTVDDILKSVGYAMPITPISIRKPIKEDGTAGEELPPGEEGEICFSGPQVFLCYVNDEENTKKTISKDGWCYTGDLGYYDDNGLHFTGRAKFVIKPKGYQVYPAEIENFIANKFKDRVELVAVIGMPHDVYSEGIVAFVEKKPGKHITVEEIKNACKEMAAYKRPEHIVIMEPAQIPLNRVEKTDYILLKNIAEEEIKKLREQGGWDRK